VVRYDVTYHSLTCGKVYSVYLRGVSWLSLRVRVEPSFTEVYVLDQGRLAMWIIPEILNLTNGEPAPVKTL
jgi:hypothetical protein